MKDTVVMSQDERAEWCYVRDERLGVLCGSGQPTPEQTRLAQEEADEHVRKLREQNA